MTDDNVVALTPEDQADLDRLYAEPDGAGADPGVSPPTQHAIGLVWLKLLEPAAKELESPIAVQWGSTMVQKYPYLTFGQLDRMREIFVEKVQEMRRIVELEFEDDDEGLKLTDPAEDLEHNWAHYINILREWQLAIVKWELEWRASDPEAGEQIASTSETYNMFFGQNSVSSHLASINLELSEDVQESFREAFDEFTRTYMEAL